MRRLRRIKILATLGPASSDLAMIRKLFEAGADVFRINMSHTPHDKMRELVKTIRNVESSYGRPIGILVDLQGPKLRLGAFAEGAVQLNTGQSVVLDPASAPGNSRSAAPRPRVAARRRQGAPDRGRDLDRPRGDAGGDRRQDVGPQGRQPA
jgi:pyruvate kinase